MLRIIQSLVSALLVITKDPQIRMFLQDNDPKALKQAEKALAETYNQAMALKDSHKSFGDKMWARAVLKLFHG